MIPEKYLSKVLFPRRAFSRIKRGENIFVSSGCGEPQYLVSEFLSFCEFLGDNEILQFFSLGPIRSISDHRDDRFRINYFFFGNTFCNHIAKGFADYTPSYLSQIPRLIREKKIKIDVAMLQVSPPDEFGNCSLGISVDIAPAAIESAKYIIAQINPRMPWTGGKSLVNIEKIDAIIPFEEPLLEWKAPQLDNITIEVGKNVAKLIDDGSTIQTGVGKIHDAVLRALANKKNLGIHTEIFTESLMELYIAGAITNSEKTIHPGKIVASCCMGSSKLYNFIHKNPAFEFYPCDYVSNPLIIARNKKMVSICSVIQIDLTGQASINSITPNFVAGIGAQPEFMRATMTAENGKTIIALPSTSRNGTVSRIVFNLHPHSGVIASRGDVQYVVTEFGIANLEGKSIRERAIALIEIAHPKFRHELLKQAKNSNFIFDDQTVPTHDEEETFNKWETSSILKDGTTIRIRLIKPSDEREIQRFKYSLSDEDIFMRFMTMGMRFNHQTVLPLTTVDFKNHVALVAVLGIPGDETIIGIGRYYSNPSSELAEVAFTVTEKWRRKGVGTALLHQLTKIAKSQNIKGFRAEILTKNKNMMRLFSKSECTIHTSIQEDICSMWYYFDT